MAKLGFALAFITSLLMTTLSYANDFGSLNLGNLGFNTPTKSTLQTSATPTSCFAYGGYPFVESGCLNATDLNNALNLSPNSIPPQNNLGQGAQYGKLWLDTSQIPPELRQCRILSGCGIYFNQNDWLNWGTIDTTNNNLNFTFNNLTVTGNFNIGNIYSTGGITVGSPTGGNEGPGTINAQAIYLNGVAITGNGGGGGSGSSTETIVSKTSNYQLLPTDTNIDFNNNGTLSTVVFLLPQTTPGIHDCFTVMTPLQVTVSAPVNSYIAVGTNISGSGGNVSNNIPYSTICLVAESASVWVAKTQVGLWTVQ
jgi:hypothetical protein